MAVYLVYPTREQHRRSDGVVALVVEASAPENAASAARGLLRTANAGDFADWSTMKIADVADAAFRPFLVQGEAIVGRAPLPALGRGGDRMVSP